IAAEGGTVHIVDTYTCADEYVEPAHAGDIVITGGKYIFTNGSYNRWYLSGEGSTTFENITFEYGAGSTSLFICQFNKLIFGEGVVLPDKFMSGEKEVTGKCYVVGGYQYNKTYTEGKEYANIDEMIADLGWATDKNSDVTIKSGKLWCVVGFCRGAASADCVFTGTSNIIIDGDAIIDSAVYGGHVNGNATAGAAVITVNGGTIADLRTTSDATYVSPIAGDVIVNVNDGTVTGLSMTNVLGKTEVNFNGGNLAQATYAFDGSLEEKKTSGETILNIAEGARALPGLAMNFTTVNGEVASPVIPGIGDLLDSEETEAVTTEVVDNTAGESSFNPLVVIIPVVLVLVAAIAVVIVIKKKK
ncbi:MAG: hypothetical protein IKY12_05575, partial [Clostridia bacterium]|nr:hypothetical protein [Clostridia bacterium]